jgi:hypothetical protein
MPSKIQMNPFRDYGLKVLCTSFGRISFFLEYSSDKDICLFLCLSDKKLYFYYFKKFRYTDRISNFHIFNPTQISMFLDIRHLFTSRISTNPNIKNLKIRLSIMLGARPFFFLGGKNSSKGNILF